MMWIRTCQECGSNQTRNRPIFGEEPTDSYMNSKCLVCKSMALDYGAEHQNDCTVTDGKWNDKCTCYEDEE